MPLRPRRTFVWLAIAGLAVYFALFYAAEMPGLTQATGRAFHRAQLLVHYLLLPEQLFDIWFGVPAEFSLLDRLPVVLIAGGILAWAAALGWLLLRLCRLDRTLTRIETFVFAAAVGLNAVSTYVLALGLLGWLNRAAVGVPAVVTLGLFFWLRWKRKAQTVRKENAWAAFLLHVRRSPDLPFVALLLLGAMLPPVDFDVREYHLQAPKEFYLQGSVSFLPHNVYASMPLGTEMLSLLGMVISGDWWLGALAGKTLLASYVVLAALGLLAAGERFACQVAGAVAALVYISTAWVIQVSSLGLVDAALGCYLFLAFYAVCLGTGSLSTEAPKKKRAVAKSDTPDTGLSAEYSMLILAGYLAGGAVSCKYPGVLFVVLPLAAWILIAFRDIALPWWRLAWKMAAVFVLVAAVACGLWFAKNWALTGNPTYPLLYSVFGGKTWTPEKDRQWNAVHRPHDFSFSALGQDIGRVALTSEWLSPLVIPLAALGLAAGSRRRLAIGAAAYFVFVIAAWWLWTHRIDRFWIPALPLAALLAGLGAAWSQERLWRIALMWFLIVGSAANFLTAASVGGGYNPYFVSLARLRDDPERVDAWHRYLNRNATQGRVLLVGDAQPFDLEMPVLYNTCFDDSIFEQLVKGRSPQEVRTAFVERGITHVYVHWGEIARYRRTYGFTEFVQPAVFDQLVSARILAPLPSILDHSGRGYRVLR